MVLRERRNSKIKVIDDDICNRKIEFKAKNEIIKMTRNYSNLRKEYGLTNTSMRIMLATKITLNMRLWGLFHNKM